MKPEDINTRQEFAQALTALRERAGLTVRDVAKAVGVPFQTVGDYFGGRHLPPRASDVLERILGACGVDDPESVAAWTSALQRVRRAPGPRPRASVTPYPGLAAFQPEHAEWFFGREQLTEVLLDRVASTDGLVLAVGASGSGKSSLLRAGLIPAARAGRLQRAATWDIALLTPGEHPVAALEAALAGVERESDGLLVIIDQFEELFAACPDDDERRAFLRALEVLRHTGELAGRTAGSQTSGQRPVALVGGMRADFYGHAVRYRQLVPVLQHNQVVVGPMSADELRSAIAEPARRVKVEVADGLVELLLADLAPAEAGALPLLAHALLATWELGEHRAMTVAAYRASGGIAHAVAQTAEDVFVTLDDEQQEWARALFLRLVQVAPDMADTRRLVPIAELTGLPRQGTAEVVELFVQQRLLSADETHVEIAHEALLRAWPRLVGWIEADRAGLRTHRQLTEAATAWQENDRDDAALYRGTRLDLARDWAAEDSHAVLLNPLERAFLDASLAHESARRRAEQRRTHRLYQLVAALGVLVLVVGGLATNAWVQGSAREHERDLAVSRQIAITANELRTTDVALAAQLSLAAYRVAPTPEARASLLESYAQPTVTRLTSASGYLQTLTVSTDGRIMATADMAGAIQLYDMSVKPPVRTSPAMDMHEGDVFGLALRSDGRVLASVGTDRLVRLWDVADPAHPQPIGEPIAGAGDTLYGVAFSPDGTLLAAVSNDQTIRLWDVSDPAAAHPTATLTMTVAMQSVAFRPDGRMLAAGSANGSVHLLDITDRAHPVTIGAPLASATSTVFALGFSPDGRVLATGGRDTLVRLWDVTDAGSPVAIGQPLAGATSWIQSLAFSPDGTTLAAGSSDSDVWVWRVGTRSLIRRLPHPAPVTSVAFLPDSRTIVSAAADGVARVWSLTAPSAPGPTKGVFAVGFLPGSRLLAPSGDDTATIWDITDPRAPIWDTPPFTAPGDHVPLDGSGAASPDGRLVALGTGKGPVQLWDVSGDHPTPSATLTGPTDLIESVAFSPDGRLLLAGSDDHNAWLWDLRDPRAPGRPLAGHTNYIYVAAFSPDGRTVATASIDDTGRLWDVSDPANPAAIGEPFVTSDNYITSVAFSPDGRLLAAGGADHLVRIFDVTDRTNPRLLGRPLPGPQGYVFAVTFSADSRLLAAGGGDGSIWIWNVIDPREPEQFAAINSSTEAVYGLGFDPQRPTLLASSGLDKTVHLWEIDPRRLAEGICASAGDPVTSAEWARYVPGSPLVAPCPIPL